MQQSRFIDPQVLAAVKQLPLVARMVAEGFLQGLHQSPRQGSGIEFSQYRAYQPGDDLRQLDWKLLARSGKYFIKESESDTQMKLWLLLDTSASMQHQVQDALSKLDYARYLLASISYIARHQGDALGLLALNEEGVRALPMRQGGQQWQHLLWELEQVAAGGKFAFPAAQLRLLAHPAMIVVVSDFYAHNDELWETVKSLKTRKNEILCFHLMASDELQGTFPSDALLQDYETGLQVRASASQKAAYLKKMEAFLEECRQKAQKAQAHYTLLDTSQPLDSALSSYLRQRLKAF